MILNKFKNIQNRTVSNVEYQLQNGFIKLYGDDSISMVIKVKYNFF